jgi:hypothetical protein
MRAAREAAQRQSVTREFVIAGLRRVADASMVFVPILDRKDNLMGSLWPIPSRQSRA